MMINPKVVAVIVDYKKFRTVVASLECCVDAMKSAFVEVDGVMCCPYCKDNMPCNCAYSDAWHAGSGALKILEDVEASDE